jgi:type I restriction enzyme S subunit
MKELKLLPESWDRVSLAEVVAVNPKHKDLVDQVAGFVPMKLAPKDFNGTLHYEERQWDKIKKGYTHFATGDVIFAKVTPCFENGKAAIVKNIPNGIGAGSTEFYVLRPANNDISVDYIFSVIKSHEFLHSGAENMTGAVGLRRVPKKFVEDFKINLPPPAEQQEIVAQLDKHLAQVESTKTRLDAIPAILKRFRQSVLAAAVSGKVTEEWREGLDSYPSKPIEPNKLKYKAELFKSAQSSLPALPIEWKVLPSAYLLEYVTSGSRGWASYYSDKGALFLRMGNVRYETTKLDLNDLQHVNLPDTVEGKRSLIKQDDLIISITADVGRVARIDRDLGEAYINQHLALARPSKSINAEYFAMCIASQNIGVKQIQELKRGATKAGLGLDDIRSLALPIPSFDEQTEIVSRVESSFAYADKVEAQVNAAQERVNSLTQSILAKAFSGELTVQWRAQNPGLISGENSAAALLEKIKEERAALTAKKKPAKKTTARKAKA